MRNRLVGVVALCAPAGLSAVGLAGSLPGVIISEVHPTGSSNGTYNADFFELTNTGASDLSIAGWRMDDNSFSFANSVGLRGITSIPAGASVVFVEGDATGSTDATVQANFINAWFGGTAPAGFLIGGYGGTGVGLSATADGVCIFDSGGAVVTGVSFGASTNHVTFDNAAGIGSAGAPFPAISALSVDGVNGAFVSGTGETGSPGVVPAPGVLGLMGLGGLVAGRRRRA